MEKTILKDIYLISGYDLKEKKFDLFMKENSRAIREFDKSPKYLLIDLNYCADLLIESCIKLFWENKVGKDIRPNTKDFNIDAVKMWLEFFPLNILNESINFYKQKFPLKLPKLKYVGL